MFERVYDGTTGKVAENDKFAIYVYKHPAESGQEKWHAHFVRKSDNVDVKLSLWNFYPMRPTQFDRGTVKAFAQWTCENRHFLRRKWVQNVLRPFFKSIEKWRRN